MYSNKLTIDNDDIHGKSIDYRTFGETVICTTTHYDSTIQSSNDATLGVPSQFECYRYKNSKCRITNAALFCLLYDVLILAKVISNDINGYISPFLEAYSFLSINIGLLIIILAFGNIIYDDSKIDKITVWRLFVPSILLFGWCCYFIVYWYLRINSMDQYGNNLLLGCIMKIIFVVFVWVILVLFNILDSYVLRYWKLFAPGIADALILVLCFQIPVAIVEAITMHSTFIYEFSHPLPIYLYAATILMVTSVLSLIMIKYSVRISNKLFKLIGSIFGVITVIVNLVCTVSMIYGNIKNVNLDVISYFMLLICTTAYGVPVVAVSGVSVIALLCFPCIIVWSHAIDK
eukprot:92788_1